MADVEIGSGNRNISGHLLEAYKNYYEEELAQEYATVADVSLESHEVFSRRRVREIILEHTPKQRIEVYLEWNGILGYADTIFDICRGDVYVGRDR
jgi:hypothetical protein